MIAILYTKSGGGKTVNSTRVPGTKLLFDSDNSSVVLNNFNRTDLDVHKILSIKDFFEAYQKAAESKKYETLIIDNGTDLIDRWLLELGEKGKNNGNPGIQDYQVVYNGFKRLMRYASVCGCNVIVNFWQDSFVITQPDGSQISMISPKMPQKILENICGLANIVGHIETSEKDGNKQWFFRLEGSNTLYAKDQLFCRKFCMPEDLFKE